MGMTKLEIRDAIMKGDYEFLLKNETREYYRRQIKRIIHGTARDQEYTNGLKSSLINRELKEVVEKWEKENK